MATGSFTASAAIQALSSAGITHAFISSKADADDESLVRPSNWNDYHVGTNPHDLVSSAHTNYIQADGRLYVRIDGLLYWLPLSLPGGDFSADAIVLDTQTKSLTAAADIVGIYFTLDAYISST